MQYRVLMEDRLDYFQNKVNSALANGWELHGTMVVDSKHYYQVVIKHMGESNESHS